MYQAAVQQICHVARPKRVSCRSRHGVHADTINLPTAAGNPTEDDVNSDVDDAPYEPVAASNVEPCGVHHLVHAWVQQGHKHTVITIFYFFFDHDDTIAH